MKKLLIVLMLAVLQGCTWVKLDSAGEQVRVVEKQHVQHCKRARVDEIIVSSELSSGLISRAALHHGITKVISELLSAIF